MNSTKITNKRGRPKRKNSEDDESSVEIAKKKPTKKSQKAVTTSKKNIEIEKSKGKKLLQKNKIDFSESDLDDESENSVQVKEENPVKMINVPLEPFKSDKYFAEILNRANKEPQFLIMLRNLLSSCSRSLKDKKNFLKKKWQQLRNSNCTQDEYLSREAELKRMQAQEIYDIQKDIMAKLSYASIKGFESKEGIIDDYKRGQPNSAQANEPEPEFFIEDLIWDRYHEEQKKLLNLLMNEKDFVFTTYKDNIIREPKGFEPKKDQYVEQNEMDIKFTNIETQQNPQSTQFFFCKHYAEINYDKVFENTSNPFKITEPDICYMDPKAISWILETKSDQIYINEKFQRENFKKYTEMLQIIYAKSYEMGDRKIIEHLLEVATYILNIVHYFQKFKLKCDLLHPLDLLLVIQKIKKDRRQKDSLRYGSMDETFEKQLEGIADSVKNIEVINDF